jgi:hypothetical protein
VSMAGCTLYVKRNDTGEVSTTTPSLQEILRQARDDRGGEPA